MLGAGGAYIECCVQEVLNTMEVYDPVVGVWSAGPPLVSRRSGVSAVSLGDKIYVIGGFDGSQRFCIPLFIVYRYIVKHACKKDNCVSMV
jgi:hypothetical protein